MLAKFNSWKDTQHTFKPAEPKLYLYLIMALLAVWLSICILKLL